MTELEGLSSELGWAEFGGDTGLVRPHPFAMKLRKNGPPAFVAVAGFVVWIRGGCGFAVAADSKWWKHRRRLPGQ